ncbi:uncharacterized protein [Aristolochia californica]|uniref:uncharacterized protein n=1 Tax=Aristolochia californica TaxID=171875 RepID=UPI0035DBF5B0
MVYIYSMVKVKRRQLRAIAERKGPVQGGRPAKPSTSETDEEQDENDWVIVKKQRIRIWIPPMSTEKPLLQSSNLKHKKAKPRQMPKESQPQIMAKRRLKHVQSEQKKTTRISKNKEKSSKTHGPAPSFRPLDCLLPQPAYEITSKDSNPFSGESAAEPSWKHMNQQTRAMNLERKLDLAGGLSRWLVSQGLEQFVLIFQRENVDKLQLLNLTMGKLKDMGAVAVGPRRKLIHAIDRLSQPYYF